MIMYTTTRSSVMDVVVPPYELPSVAWETKLVNLSSENDIDMLGVRDLEWDLRICSSITVSILRKSDR